MKKLIITILFVFSVIFGQNPDPKEILKKTEDRFLEVKDYSADVKIKLDLAFLKMSDSQAKVYFKAPDKFKIDSKGFAMLPKEGINYNPAKFMKGDFTAIFIKEDKYEDNSCYIVKIIPNSDTVDVVVTTLYIDKGNYFIRHIESTTKQGGNIKIFLTYDKNRKLPLPDKVRFSFNIDGDKNKKEIKDPDKNVRKQMNAQNISGDVYIYYSNYKINKGLNDNLFVKEKKDSKKS
ncbi:MAG TPA: hypothetical protein PL041_08630 [Melioribacteraceae bacterium]|nr:hypothetical protein [Melioribacteraceae bacterium]